MTKRKPTGVDKIIGRNITYYRTKKSLSQEKLAERLDLSTSQIQKYEKGLTRVAASTLSEIAEVLDSDIEEFFVDPAKRNDGLADIAGNPPDTVTFDVIEGLPLH